MAEAMRLAWRGRYGAHPNPRVGCVIVSDGVVVGRGYHEAAGGPHAEVHALAEAGGRAAGATVYVTLEPCDHHGKTAPCSEALIAAGVARVVTGMQDPFPRVAGNGLRRLAAAGIETAIGLLEPEARRLNEGYLSRMERGRPRLTLKMAASLDGATAMQSGESRWITGEAARRDVQRLRAESGAILTGVGTVLDDDPALTVRDVEVPKPPLRAVVDSRLRMPATASMLKEDGRTLVYCSDASGRGPLENAGAMVVELPPGEGGVSLQAVLDDLAAREVNDVLAECGPRLAGALLAAGLCDRLVIYQSPHIMGSETRPLVDTPGWQRLADRLALELTDTRRIGADTRLIARPAGRRN